MRKNTSLVVLVLIVLLVSLLLLTSCGGGNSTNGSSSTGMFNLSITDAPVDGASKVVVKFTGVDIHSSSGNLIHIDVSPPKQIDLLSLNSGGSEVILENEILPSGDYQWVRLNIEADCDANDDSYIEIDNTKHSIWIPSGNQSGLKLVRGFNLPADGIADFTIDFDLRKSVTFPEGNGNCADNYKLRPALRIVNNTEVGSIAGNINPSLINDGTCTGGNAVYVFQDHNITPDDIDEIAPDPISTTIVKLDDNGHYVYRASFLNTGDYTIAFTCQADGDDPELNDIIDFVGTENVSVTAGLVTIHDFQ
jgi:hypothetical protein